MGWGVLYFYFCIVYIKNYSAHLCFLHCLFPYLYFELVREPRGCTYEEGGEAWAFLLDSHSVPGFRGQ